MKNAKCQGASPLQRSKDSKDGPAFAHAADREQGLSSTDSVHAGRRQKAPDIDAPQTISKPRRLLGVLPSCCRRQKPQLAPPVQSR